MDFTESYVNTISEYEGRIISVKVDAVSLPGGGEAFREYVIHPGGVTVVPLDEDGYVYCVRQYRYPMGQTLLETPAGKLEPDEDPLDCALRELGEETGITADELVDLGALYPSPGFCRETLYIYLARGLHFGTAHPDENEILNVERVKLSELCSMAMRNELRDAKTVVAVLKTKLYLEGGEHGEDSPHC